MKKKTLTVVVTHEYEFDIEHDTLMKMAGFEEIRKTLCVVKPPESVHCIGGHGGWIAEMKRSMKSVTGFSVTPEFAEPRVKFTIAKD